MIRRVIFSIALALAPVAAVAQQGVPHAAYVYPAGGKVGTTFEVTVGGQFLNGAREAFIDGSGVKVEVLSIKLPLNGMQLQDTRDQLQKLVQSHGGAPGQLNPQRQPNPQQQQRQQQRQEKQQERQQQREQTQPQKRPGAPNQQAAAAAAQTPAPAQPITPWTPEDLAKAKELRDTIESSMRRLTAPALAQSATLRVTIAADAIPGTRELRLLTVQGLTNPLVFCVDQLNEVSKPFQWVPTRLAAGGGLAVRDDGIRPPTQPIPQEITLPAILNGQMMPSAVDRYRFHAIKGQQIVIAAKTRALIPYISDAVPGWFQATLSLYDSAGQELASADHFRFSQDPVIAQQIPADGDYVVAVHDAIFRGREDFVYRIEIGELPFVTGIFPLGTKQGAKTRVDLTGWNLSGSQFSPSARNAGLRVLTPADGWKANPVAFAVDTLPELTQAQPTVSIKNAKKIKPPIVINGRIARPGDIATFRIDAKAGDEIVAEVFARRLGSPLDSLLTLTDAAGKQLAINDDSDDKGAALLTHQADSRVSFRFPAKGTYYLQLADAQRNGGPEFAYRLRVSRPQPDFELRVTPSSISVRPGMTVAATVYVLRRDGFTGEVALKIKDAPSGMTLHGGVIPAGADSVRVTLTAPPQGAPAPHTLLLEGEAQIASRSVRHIGVPADDMQQAFAWHHLVPSKEGLALVFGGGRRNPVWKIDDNRVKVPVGGTAQIHVGVPAAQLGNQVTFALSDPPEGISIAGVSKGNGTLDVLLRADGKVKPGVKGNLIVDASIIRPRNPANPNPGPNANRPVPIGTLPAIPFEIVQP
jgi:hypothetical protein